MGMEAAEAAESRSAASTCGAHGAAEPACSARGGDGQDAWTRSMPADAEEPLARTRGDARDRADVVGCGTHPWRGEGGGAGVAGAAAGGATGGAPVGDINSSAGGSADVRIDAIPKQVIERDSPRVAKSCYGYLLYSQKMRAGDRNPYCAGFKRTTASKALLEPVSAELSAQVEGTDFYYVCVGKSIYNYRVGPTPPGDKHLEMPVCEGLEVLITNPKVEGDPGYVPSGRPAQPEARTRVPVMTNTSHQSPTRTPATPGLEGFPERFMKLSGKIAGRMMNDVEWLFRTVTDVLTGGGSSRGSSASGGGAGGGVFRGGGGGGT